MTAESAVDRTMRPTHCVRAAPIDPSRELGIHQPKLAGDIGWDLVAMHSVKLEPGQARDVPVNARIELPRGVYADIRNRSSMARRDLYVDHNLIDTGYRGDLFVFIRNMKPAIGVLTVNAGIARYPDRTETTYADLTKTNTVWIQEGERIAQLVFHRASPVWMMPVDEISQTTERGVNGFGSTGK
jgi:dUTPase